MQYLHTSEEALAEAVSAYHTAAYCIIEGDPRMNDMAIRAWKMAEGDEDDALVILAALLRLHDEDI